MILLDNAIKFSSPGSAVACIWEYGIARGLRISVSDQGPGIAAAIVDAHRGRIEVESEQQKGSTFRAVLPEA